MLAAFKSPGSRLHTQHINKTSLIIFVPPVHSVNTDLDLDTVNSLTVISWANNFDPLYSSVSFIKVTRCNRSTLNSVKVTNGSSEKKTKKTV